jgi:TolB-like protein/Tfp pilus assembly protein PilF
MSLFNELKRRNVLRVGTAYVVASWLLIQVVETIFPAFGFGDAAIRVVVIVVAIAFIPVLVFSWVFEITPEGLKKEIDIDREQSITPVTGKWLDRFIMVLLALALGYFSFDKFILDPVRDDRIVEAARQEGRSEALENSWGERSIAVLPFANRSALDRDVFFVDGVHDDLLTLLSKLGDLKVISRTSVEKFRGTGLSIPEVARQLGVTTILEGAVQRAGDQVRINVQLIDAETDGHLWAETYDRELTAQNIFAIQSDIARAIAQALQAVLSPEEESRVAAVPTSNFAAYEEYLRGRQKLISRTIPDIRAAAEHFHTSIELDPKYAMAYVGLAEAYFLLRYYGDMSVAETNPLLESTVSSSLELDPELGEAHTAYAAMLENRGRSHEAVAAYEKAIELAPGYATSYHWLAELWRRGLSEPGLALPLIRKALELDPLSPVINITVAETLRDLGRHPEALAQIDHTIDIAPAYPTAYIVKAELMVWSFGELDQALRLYGYAIELDPQSLIAHLSIARVFSTLGDEARAIDNIERCLELGPDYYLGHSVAVVIYQVSGDPERALRHARRSYSINPGRSRASLRLLRDLDIKKGQAEDARERYEENFSEFAGQQILKVTRRNYGVAIDYAYLLYAAGEIDRLRQILLPVLDYLPEVSRLGIRGIYIDDVRALAMLGETDKALETLGDAVAEGWRWNWRLFLSLPSLDSIRDDPRFIAQKEILETDMAAQLESYRASQVNP